MTTLLLLLGLAVVLLLVAFGAANFLTDLGYGSSPAARVRRSIPADEDRLAAFWPSRDERRHSWRSTATRDRDETEVDDGAWAGPDENQVVETAVG